MLRVGYPAVLPIELFKDYPEGVELIPIAGTLDHDVEIDVWIPDPYSNVALKARPRLKGIKLVLSLMAGTEWIPAAVGPHVKICNASGAHNIATTEWTIGAILAMLNYFPQYQEIQRAGVWKQRFKMPTHYAQVTGDKLAAVSAGDAGGTDGKDGAAGGVWVDWQRDCTDAWSRLNVELIRVARSGRTEPTVHAVSDLDALLPEAQVVILILPSTAESHHLIGARQMDLMQQGTLLVNAARGPIVDTDALVAALQGGKIRAALDVADPEPLPDGHPLWSCPNLLMTPHVGGSSPMFAARAVKVAEGELRRYIAGEAMRNVVQAAD